MIPIKSAAAGTAGSPYREVLTYTGKGTGNHVINETNFAGIGKYLPGWVLIASGTPANTSVQVSTDNGTTWKTVYDTGGGLIYVDDATTVRIVIATAATDIFLFPLATS